jgi:hypothetical protein
VYIDDIDVCIVGTTNIIKFADHTKCWKVIENDNDKADLQKTLDNMCSWAERWGMSFNAGKCKVMHIGTNNPRYKYYMNERGKRCRCLYQHHFEAQQSLQKNSKQSHGSPHTDHKKFPLQGPTYLP